MQPEARHAGNVVLIRGAALWLLMALALAWCMVGLNLGVGPLKAVFSGKFTRLLQAHLDFLLMSALIFGFYAARVSLPWHVRWAIVVGAFTNSSMFLLLSIFPELDSPAPPADLFGQIFQACRLASIIITSYGFGAGAVIVLTSTFRVRPESS